jgi:hypothetical protein
MKVTQEMVEAFESGSAGEVPGRMMYVEAGIQAVLDLIEPRQWQMKTDDDGHVYLVPVELATEFDDYVYGLGEVDYPDGVVSVGGAPSRVTFSSPEIDGKPVAGQLWEEQS